MSDLAFEDEDRRTFAYRKLVEYIDQRIAELRASNDSLKLDAAETAVVRGRIAELKNLLAKAQPSPVLEVNEG